MENRNELRKYLVGRFLLTLFVILICQALLNLCMRSLILPGLEDIMNLNGLLSGKSVGEALQIFLTCLLVVIFRRFSGWSGALEFLMGDDNQSGFFDNEFRATIIRINEQLEDEKLGLFSLKIVIFFLLLLLVWVLPYVLGAIAYSGHVDEKVKQVEKERIAREKEFEKQRNLLLSDITHDIKTPITSIVGFSKALSDGTIGEEDRQAYLESVYNKSMHVSELVTLLFEYVKLDSKGYVLNMAKLDMAELTRECVAELYADFESKNMSLELDISDAAVYVNADSMQLKRVICNLLTNTVKHNNAGTEVFVKLYAQNNQACLEISDKGVRIPTEDALHLFEPFVRGDKSRQSGTGNGLGLSISKKLVEMHGGRIRLIQFRDVEKHNRVKIFEVVIPLMK